MRDHSQPSLTTRVVASFLDSNFSVLLILIAVAMGAAALLVTPREEDPQVIVPFIDVYVDVPGATPDEVKSLAAEPLERLMFEIHGVEHVYSIALPSARTARRRSSTSRPRSARTQIVSHRK